MRRFASGAFVGFWGVIFILVLWFLIPPGWQKGFAGPQQKNMILPEKPGDFRFYYLCKPQGVLNENPCNPSAGSGLFGISDYLEEASVREDPFLFFITGELFPLEHTKEDPFQVLHDEHNFATLIRLYKTMNVTAVLPGLGDLLMGIDRFKELAATGGLRPVCANLVEREGETPVFEPFFIQELNGFKIGITGVINPRTYSVEAGDEDRPQAMQKRENVSIVDLLGEKDLEVIDPLECLSTLAADLKKKGADFTVALSHLTLRRSRDILKTTAVDVVLGNNLCRKDNYRRRVDGIRGATIHSVQSLGRMDFHLSGKKNDTLGDRSNLESLEAEQAEVEARLDELVARYGTEDPEKLARLAAGTNDGEIYKKSLERRRELVPEIAAVRRECEGSHVYNRFIEGIGSMTGGKSLAAEVWTEYLAAMKTVTQGHVGEIEEFLRDKIDEQNYVVDPAACRECHPRQVQHWENTRHARAFQSVARLQCDYHTECVRCHSTGYRVKNGYFIPPPPEAFRGINCEVCHGFVGTHLNDFIDPTQAKLKGEMEKIAALCMYCHEQERSPDFDYKSAIETVACPTIDFDSSLVRKIYLERDAAMTKKLSGEGGDVDSNDYVKAAIYKKRLGAGRQEVIDLLYRGFELDANNIDLVRFLSQLLLEERKAEEALNVMETYILENQSDREINLAIIRLLTLSPKVNDPKAARDYIAWYFENLGQGNLELYLLLATADLQLGEPFNLDEAWAALERAEEFKPGPEDREKINMLREELIRRRK